MTGATATVLTVTPGDGFKYIIVHGVAADGQPFLAVPTLGAAAVCTPYPAESGYLRAKLGVTEHEAEIIFQALRNA